MVGLASPPEGWVLSTVTVSIVFYREMQVNPETQNFASYSQPIPSFDCSKVLEGKKTAATATG